MAIILFVRVKSKLEWEELERRLLKRKPYFKEVPGLIQKIYGWDESSSSACGIYFFKDQKSLTAFRETELDTTIPGAYEATEVRPEVYKVLFPLYPEHGPVIE